MAKEVYKNAKIDGELLRKRIIDLAYNNPGLTFYFNGEKFLFEKGLYQLAQRVDSETAQNPRARSARLRVGERTDAPGWGPIGKGGTA